MRIRAVGCEDFLSFGPKQILVGSNDINNIVGPNNSGKTNLFRAVDFVAEALTSRITNSSPYYHNQDLSKPFRVELSLEFEDQEVDALCNALVFTVLASSTINRLSSLEGNQPNLETARREVVSKLGKSVFKTMFDDVSITVSASTSEYFPPNIMLCFRHKGAEIYYHAWGQLSSKPYQLQGYGTVDFNEALLKYAIDTTPELADYIKGVGSLPSIPQGHQPPDIYQMFSARAEPNLPAGASLNRVNFGQVGQFGSNPTVQELRSFYQAMNLKFDDSTQISLQDVLTLILLNSTVLVPDARGSRSVAYLEQEEALDSPGHHLSIDHLAHVLFRLTNSEFVAEKRRYEDAKRLFGKLTGGLTFEVALRKRTIQGERTSQLEWIQQPPGQFSSASEPSMLGLQTKPTTKIMHELVIEVRDSNVSTPLSMSAAGIGEALLLATAIGGQEGKTILLDEPGQNMHPTLQHTLLDAIHQSIQEHNNQFFAITHSPYLIRPDEVAKTWRVNVTANGSVCTNLGRIFDSFDKTSQESLERYLRSADVRALLFSRGVVLVEGPSDKIVVEKVNEFLSGSKSNQNLATNDWSVIDTGGKDGFPTFVRMCRLIGLPFVILADWDSLMEVGRKTAMPDGDSYRSSAVLRALVIGETLNERETALVKRLRTVQLADENNKIRDWYEAESGIELIQLAQKHRVFIFTKDLEGALQNPITKRESKPLKAIDKVSNLVKEQRIPIELKRMERWLEKRMLESAS